MERAHACGAKRPNPKSNAARAAQRHWAEGGTGVRSLARARVKKREREGAARSALRATYDMVAGGRPSARGVAACSAAPLLLARRKKRRIMIAFVRLPPYF